MQDDLESSAAADDSVEEIPASSETPLCPYCGTAVESDPIDCPACSTTYHFDCASEAGGCVLPGCTNSVLSVTAPPPPPPAFPASSVEQPPDATAVAAPSNQTKQKRKVPRLVVPVAALIVGLLLGGLVIKTNIASAIVGKTYSKSDVTDAEDKGYTAGYSSGKDAGYSSGRASGLSEGKSAGCRAVFTALGTTRVMDFYDWYLVYTVPSSLSSSAC